MKRDLDFLKAYRQNAKATKKAQVLGGRLKKRFLLIGILNLVVAGLLAGGIFTYRLFVLDQWKELDGYVNGSEDSVKYQQILKEQGTYGKIQQYNTLVTGAAQTIQNRPLLSSKAYESLNANMSTGMKWIKFQMEQDQLTAVFEIPRSADIENYVEKVMQSETFSAVTYNGWEQMDENIYQFQVICTLKQEGASK